MKGFVVTLVTMGIIVLLVMLTSALHNGHKEIERAVLEPEKISYGAVMFDSVKQDLDSITGSNITMSQSNDSITLTVNDTVPQQNYTTLLSDYESFLENTTANKTHSTIDINLSNLSSGDLTIHINEDYTYQNDFTSGEMLFTKSVTTNATEYAITIDVGKTRQSLTDFTYNASGDLNISINYTDFNGTETISGTLSSDNPNRLEINYLEGGYLYIDIGQKNGNDGSLWIKTSNANATVGWTAKLPSIEDDKMLGHRYDATLEYLQDKISIARTIGE